MISWNLKTRSVRPIGLDIGHSSVKMIQLGVSGGRIGVLAAEKTCIKLNIDDNPEAFRQDVVSAVKQMLAKGSFQGRSVVSCLPNDNVKITSVRIGQTESDQIEQVLRKEAVHRFGLDPQTDSIKYVDAGSVHHGDELKNELILFAVDAQTTKDHIAVLEDAGLEPVAIDTVPFALFRGFERWQRRETDKEHTVVFVDVGNRSTTVVFGRGGEISFVKQIPIGGHRFSEGVAEKLGINIAEAERVRERLRIERGSAEGIGEASEEGWCDTEERLDAATRQVVVDALSSVAEELAKEVSLCLRYFTVTFRGKRVERAVLSGGEAYESILLNVLRRQLTVEIEVAQPLKGFDLSSSREGINLGGDRRGLLCEWAVAVGLGLKNMSEASVGAEA
ncbi:MAG: pilus assembly protein PilM [Sedimentisphaerales bacterium]|nr:pilus assembly protein PilM [Sedimentisphaerales bacterium]